MSEEVNNKINKDVKQILSVRVPCKINNIEKAIKYLGGLDNIYNSNKFNKDINFELLNIDLEKSISYDYLIKRKRLRSKNKTKADKIEFQIIGKIPFSYNFYSLCDFLYTKNENNLTIDNNNYYSNLYESIYQLNEHDSILKSLNNELITNEDTSKSNFLDNFALDKFCVGRNKYQASINNTLLSKLNFEK